MNRRARAWIIFTLNVVAFVGNAALAAILATGGKPSWPALVFVGFNGAAALFMWFADLRRRPEVGR